MNSKWISKLVLILFAFCLIAWLWLGPDWSAPKEPLALFNLAGSNGFAVVALLLGCLWLLFRPAKVPVRKRTRRVPVVTFYSQNTEDGPIVYMTTVRLL